MSLVIIGTGLAGYNLARFWRQSDTSTELTLLTEDLGHFYSKPLLSNGISQKKDIEALALNTAEDMCEKLKATILTQTTVKAIDPSERMLTTSNGTLPYSKLVLALGACPTRPFPVAPDVPFYQINSLTDYNKLYTAMPQYQQIAVIGSGLVGCEFANDLHQAGYQVTLVSMDEYPLQKFLPPPAGNALKQAFVEAGIHWIGNAHVNTIDMHDKKCSISLHDSTVIKADCIISATGILPSLSLAQSAHLSTDQGIITDQFCQTSNSYIYALGDCAQINGYCLQYVMPLMNAARALAKTLNGTPTKVHYPAMPVIAKTHLCPIRFVPPPLGYTAHWQLVSQTETSVTMLATDDNGTTLGYALTGEAVKQAGKFSAQLPVWMAA